MVSAWRFVGGWLEGGGSLVGVGWVVFKGGLKVGQRLLRGCFGVSWVGWGAGWKLLGRWLGVGCVLARDRLKVAWRIVGW